MFMKCCKYSVIKSRCSLFINDYFKYSIIMCSMLINYLWRRGVLVVDFSIINSQRRVIGRKWLDSHVIVRLLLLIRLRNYSDWKR